MEGLVLGAELVGLVAGEEESGLELMVEWVELV